MLTPEESFCVGFLTYCAEHGLSEMQINEKIAQAADFVKQAGWPEIDKLMLKPLTAAVGVGMLGGGALGAGAALAMQDVRDPLSIKQPEILNRIQQAELASAYRQNAEIARQQALLAKRRRNRERVRSPYGI